MNNSFYKSYLHKISNLEKEIDIKKIQSLEGLILSTSKKKGKVIIFGNGGSAATASHVAVDLTKNAGVKSLTFNEYDLITCYSNDYGYENWMKKSIEFYCNKEDMVIFLSCSGNSPNVVNACKYAIKRNIKTVALTGIGSNNKLNKLKNNLNIWIDSKNYNMVEIIHHMILLSIVDKIIDNKKKNK